MTEPAASPEEIERRKRAFEEYVHALEHDSVVEPRVKGVRYRCPCCGCRTLGERGGFEICKVCFWEDDGQDEGDTETVRGGPNGWLSLAEARRNFGKFGACERKFLSQVRKAKPEEV